MGQKLLYLWGDLKADSMPEFPSAPTGTCVTMLKSEQQGLNPGIHTWTTVLPTF